jgi:hypothetical protein
VSASIMQSSGTTWNAVLRGPPTQGACCRIDGLVNSTMVLPVGRTHLFVETGSHDRMPTFLVQRRDGLVVLTGFLSDQMQNRVTRHHSVTKAMRFGFATVLAMAPARSRDQAVACAIIPLCLTFCS